MTDYRASSRLASYQMTRTSAYVTDGQPKRLIAFDELPENKYIPEEYVDALKRMSGGYKLGINPKNKDLFDAACKFVIILAANSMPKFAGSDLGPLYERFVIFTFDKKENYNNDITLTDSTADEIIREEGSDIIKYLLGAYKRMNHSAQRRCDKITMCEEDIVQKWELETENNTAIYYLRTYYKITNDSTDRIVKQDIYEGYRLWYDKSMSNKKTWQGEIVFWKSFQKWIKQQMCMK